MGYSENDDLNSTYNHNQEYSTIEYQKNGKLKIEKYFYGNGTLASSTKVEDKTGRKAEKLSCFTKME